MLTRFSPREWRIHFTPREWLKELRSMWPWLVAAVFCGGVIHVVAVLALPYLAKRDAWARLSEISDTNQMYLLPVAQPNPPLPYMAPDVAYAFCRFDLTKNNVQIQAALGDSAWNVAISGRYGDNFYFVSGAEAKRREWRLLIVPRARLAEEASTEQSEEGEKQRIVISPGMTGVIMVQAPLRGPSFADDTLDALRKTACVPVAIPDPAQAALARQRKAVPPSPQRRSRSRVRHRRHRRDR
ncbi:MAG: hypothetical protein P8Y67_04310 [Alphaproteobacteria bacterium]